MNKNLQRLAEPGGRLYLIFLVLFAAAALFFKMYELAVAEGVIILILMSYSFFSRRRTGGRLMLILHLDYILYYAAPSAARQILVFLPCFLCGILRMSLL